MASGERRRSGQHMAEFVVLMGITVTAALAVQYLTQRAIRTGVQRVSDEALGPPPPAKVTTAQSHVNVTSTQTVTESGDAGFHRRTTVDESDKGDSLNEDVRLRAVPGS